MNTVICVVVFSMPCVFGTNTTLSSMTHFLKSVRGYDNPQQRYLADMLQSLISARAALIFIGDSTLNVRVFSRGDVCICCCDCL